ncbi:MAG: hypothetical protein ACR2QM_15775 [Longimicrobiales bacterium]
MAIQPLSFTHRFLCAALVLAGSVIGQPLEGQSAGATPALGSIDFPATGAAAAHDAFIKGVLLLHNFEYEDAARAFQDARRIDPDMVMAYWGEAMTYNHPVWMQQDRDAALRVLSEYAPSTKARLEKAPTPREQDWLLTVETLYGEGTKEERDFKYRDAMRRLQDQYPDDDEAATFHALSILGTAHEGRDFPVYMRAAAVAQPVFQRNPEHPGAAHYVIHAFDDPVHAPLGLPAARAYAQIAPDAGHAQHMTSHIFVAMGLWDDVIAANIQARDVQNAGLVQKGRPPNVCGHYTSWLHYGYLQQGRLTEAEQTMADCQARMAENPNRAEAGYFVSMRAREVIDAQDWEAASKWTADLGNFPGLKIRNDFTDAFAALRMGDPDLAQSIRSTLGDPDQAPSPREKILLLSLDGLLSLAASETQSEGVALLTQAADLEETLPYEFGPPATLMPPHELLATELAFLSQPQSARPYWEEQLARTPQRSASLLGLARAAERTGDDVIAKETYRTLAVVWEQADRNVLGLDEVRGASEEERR